VGNSSSSPIPNYPSESGFSFQLNAYSPKNEKSAVQQYGFELDEKQPGCFINNWAVSGDDLIDVINIRPDTVSLPSAGILAGYVLKITLHNDVNNNITGATYRVTDDGGNTIVNTTISIIGELEAPPIAPIVAFELNLVGPAIGESTVLSSGAGIITYQAKRTPLTAIEAAPPCAAEPTAMTEETANSLYTELPRGEHIQLSQTFSIATLESQFVYHEGKIRPSKLFHRARRHKSSAFSA
jgi:hypothetical protein